MRILSTILLTSIICSNASAAPEVVYGQDNRKDVYETMNATLKTQSQATAMMISLGHFQIKDRQNLSFSFPHAKTIKETMNLCSGQKFEGQKNPGRCSGFLVGEDVLVTAGHCYLSQTTAQDACKNFAWVFDYKLKNAKDDPTQTVYGENVYLCKEVVAATFNGTDDFAVIKLNRKVKNRKPLQYRTSGALLGNESVAAIGHPSGLPTKITDGGKVTNIANAKKFSSTLDTFQGNSGSAVINTKTGLVEGILVAGKIDYVNSIPSNPKSCLVVNTCDENGKNCIIDYPTLNETSKGELVYRIKQIDSIIKKAQAKI